MRSHKEVRIVARTKETDHEKTGVARLDRSGASMTAQASCQARQQVDRIVRCIRFTCHLLSEFMVARTHANTCSVAEKSNLELKMSQKERDRENSLLTVDCFYDSSGHNRNASERASGSHLQPIRVCLLLHAHFGGRSSASKS